MNESSLLSVNMMRMNVQSRSKDNSREGEKRGKYGQLLLFDRDDNCGALKGYCLYFSL